MSVTHLSVDDPSVVPDPALPAADPPVAVASVRTVRTGPGAGRRPQVAWASRTGGRGRVRPGGTDVARSTFIIDP
ncbi:hypothetical protein [Streptomyces uncialis]|uniref:hypothetical protein n=1 Tax=Streptomyces uncialis TaxID=1048205 RepID=UPI00340A2739